MTKTNFNTVWKYRIITAFTGNEDLYNPADSNKQIPERLKTLFADVGNLDPDVKARLDYANLINGQSDIIQQMILDRKKLTVIIVEYLLTIYY